MTTEVGSETEVKKDPEQVGPDKAKDKPEEASETVENEKSGKTSSEEPQDSSSVPAPASHSSPSSQKKEKDSSESKGISRFLPPWLKKQKSYTLAEPKDEAKKRAAGEEQVVEESECHPPEGMAQPKRILEVVAENNAKADDKEEKHSVSSAETQVCVRLLIAFEQFQGNLVDLCNSCKALLASSWKDSSCYLAFCAIGLIQL